MALPAATTTCDIYRSANSPPAAPDAAGIPCVLIPRGRSTLTTPGYTHVLLVPPAVDIRDAYSPGALAFGAAADKVYVPDRASGVVFRVVLVRRVGRGTAFDHKEALLVRQSVTWPTNDV
jgi:hypothetical protein